MLHVCVRRSDITDNVQTFLETKQSLSFGSSEPNSIKRTLIGWSILKERLAWKLFKVSDFTKCCKPLLAQLTCKLHLFLQGSETNDASEVWIDQDLDEPCHEPWWPLWSSQSMSMLLRNLDPLPDTEQYLDSVFRWNAKKICDKILLIWSIKWSLFIKLFVQMGCKSRDKSNDAN